MAPPSARANPPADKAGNGSSDTKQPLTEKTERENVSAETPINSPGGTALTSNTRRRKSSALKERLEKEAKQKAGGKWVDASSVKRSEGRSVVDYVPGELAHRTGEKRSKGKRNAKRSDVKREAE